MDKESLQMMSFDIIGHAGDAFADFYNAVEAARKGEFATAEQLLKSGDEKMNEAHNSQTDLLAKEAQGEELPFSIYLIHAQDHLMTTIMYRRMAVQMIAVLKDVKEK